MAKKLILAAIVTLFILTFLASSVRADPGSVQCGIFSNYEAFNAHNAGNLQDWIGYVLGWTVDGVDFSSSPVQLNKTQYSCYGLPCWTNNVGIMHASLCNNSNGYYVPCGSCYNSGPLPFSRVSCDTPGAVPDIVSEVDCNLNVEEMLMCNGDAGAANLSDSLNNVRFSTILTLNWLIPNPEGQDPQCDLAARTLAGWWSQNTMRGFYDSSEVNPNGDLASPFDPHTITFGINHQFDNMQEVSATPIAVTSNVIVDAGLTISEINSSGTTKLSSKDNLVIGHNYSITSKGMASGTDYLIRQGASLFYVNISIGNFSYPVELNLSQGSDLGGGIFRFTSTFNFTMAKDYITNGSVPFSAFWNQGMVLNEVSDPSQTDNLAALTQSAIQPIFDLAIKNIIIKNASGQAITAYAINDTNQRNNLTVQILYGNSGGASISHNITLLVFLTNDTNNTDPVYTKILPGVNGLENNNLSFNLTVARLSSACKYGECIFFAKTNNITEDINMSNNNFTNLFGLDEIFSVQMSGNIPAYYNSNTKQFYVVKRNQSYTFSMLYIGRNASFNCLQPDTSGNLVSCSQTNSSIVTDVKNSKTLRKQINFTVKTNSSGPVGFYLANLSVGDITNKNFTYGVIFNTALVNGNDIDAYLLSPNSDSQIETLVPGYPQRNTFLYGKRSDYSFDYAITNASITGGLVYAFEASPYSLFPQDPKIINMTLAVISGQTDIKGAINIVSQALNINNQYNNSVQNTAKNVSTLISVLTMENLINASRDLNFNPSVKMQMFCTQFSAVETAFLRSAGIPSRGVSGFSANDSEIGHSWTEAYISGSDPWFAVDDWNQGIFARADFPTAGKYLGIITSKPGWIYDSLVEFNGSKISGGYVFYENVTNNSMAISDNAWVQDHFILDCGVNKAYKSTSTCTTVHVRNRVYGK